TQQAAKGGKLATSSIASRVLVGWLGRATLFLVLSVHATSTIGHGVDFLLNCSPFLGRPLFHFRLPNCMCLCTGLHSLGLMLLVVLERKQDTKNDSCKLYSYCNDCLS